MAVDDRVLVTTADAELVDIEDVASRLATVMGQELHRHFLEETETPFKELARRFYAALSTPLTSLLPRHAAEALSEGWELSKGLTIVSTRPSNLVCDGSAWLHVCRRSAADPTSAAAAALEILAYYRPKRYKVILEFPSHPDAKVIAELQGQHDSDRDNAGV